VSAATEAVRQTQLIRRKLKNTPWHIFHEPLTAAVGNLQLYFPIRRSIVSNYSEDGFKLLMGWTYGIVNCTMYHVTPTWTSGLVSVYIISIQRTNKLF